MKLTPPFVVVIDRTEWKFGSTWHNILTLSVASGDVAVPILWRFLKRKGCSEDAEREEIMSGFLQMFAVTDIRYVCADREFASVKWLEFLTREKISYRLRIKANHELTDKRGKPIKARKLVGAADLTEKLQARGYAAEAMHGDMNQNQRETVIRRLRGGQVEIVVATDVAARGLDVERISTVVNYDMPSDTESYVHRIGRTGRAGHEGKAILFVTPRQQRMKRDIEKYTGQNIEPMKMPTQADVSARRVALLKERILKALKEEELDLYLSVVEDLAEESECDIAEIAAAVVYLAGGDKPIEVKIEPEPEELPYLGEGMVRLFMEVGRQNKVGPADIVGAIANEGNIPGKAIGGIDIYDRFTLVDVPSEYVKQVLHEMRNTRIRGDNANIRIAAQRDMAAGEAPRSRPDRDKKRPKSKFYERKDKPADHKKRKKPAKRAKTK